MEAAFRTPYKVTDVWGDHIPPEKLTAHHVNERRRIGGKVLAMSDPWFDFSNRQYYQVAQQVVASLPEAEDYWKEKKEPNQPPDPTRYARGSS